MENNYPIQLVKIRENQDEYFKEGISGSTSLPCYKVAF